MNDVGVGWMAGLVVLLGLGGCATHPFAEVAAPARSRLASVALVGQSCSRENDPNWSYADILGLDLQVRVDNTSAAALSVDPKRMALLAGGQTYRPRRGDVAQVVPPGASRTFTVHFWERNGDLTCNMPMALAPDRAVTAGDATVTFAPITLRATSGDS